MRPAGFPARMLRWSDVKGTTFEAADGVDDVPCAASFQRVRVPHG